MEQCLQTWRIQSDDVTTRSPEAAPTLRLQTTGPGNLAYLEQDGDGRVLLHFRGLRFDVDDCIPDSLAGRCRGPASTAGQFVCRQMLTYHGYHEESWPALARQFLLQHVTPRRRA